MNPPFRKTIALTLTAGLLASGCSNLSPGENAAVFGSLGGAAAGGIARAAGMSTGESIATGAAVGAVIAATTFIIAKHQATERQRRIARARAVHAYARMTPQRKATLKKKKVRYLAVDTVRDERSSPKAKKAVMIWDTEAQEIVGNNVYDVQSPPPVGKTERFETYAAEYVGGE